VNKVNRDKTNTSAPRGNEHRNPERTKARILEAARTEFSEKGLEGARVNTIAEVAGVNKQMIYYYFDDKERLYTEVLEQAYKDIRERGRTLELDEMDPAEAMGAFIRSNYDFLIENRHFVGLVNDENTHKARHIKTSKQIPALHETLQTSLGRTLQRGIDGGQFARRVEPMELYISIASLTYFSISNTFTLSAIFSTDVTSPDRLAARRERVVDIVLCFLKTPETEPDSDTSLS